MASPKGGDGVGLAGNFPTDPSEFDSDPRISFSKLDNQFLLETEDGQEFVYDGVLKRWVHQVCFCAHCFASMASPAQTVSHLGIGLFADAECLQVDEELLRQQQEAYKVAGVDENEQIDLRDRKKRKHPADDVSPRLPFAFTPPLRLLTLLGFHRQTYPSRKSSA